MANFEKIKAFAPMLAAGLIAACMTTSLSGYEAPVYAVEQIAMAEDIEIEETEEKESVNGSFDLPDGVYEGTGTGFAGKITVAVQIKDKSIVAIEIIDAGSDDAAFVNRAKGVIDKIIESQSLDVDVVSGATYSSNGIIAAVKNALTGEEDTTVVSQTASSSSGVGSTTISEVEEASAYKDGTYYGSGTGFGGTTTVKVVISGGKITSINIESTKDDSSYIQRASSLISEIIAGQTTNVDTVSGATYSSVGIIEAVRDALSQAAVTENSVSDTTQTGQNGQDTEDTVDLSGRFPYLEGIYYGTGEGFNADVTVAVVIQNETIVAIVVTEHEDDETFMERAKKVAENVVAGQTTEIDVVSGATYSSEGILEAIKNALAEAERITNAKDADAEEGIEIPDAEDDAEPGTQTPGEEGDAESGTVTPGAEDAEPGTETPDTDEPEEDEKVYIPVLYNNGEYTIAVECHPDEDEDFEPYNLSMTVTVKDDKITAVTDIAGDGDEDNNRYITWAAEGRSSYIGVVAQILEKGAPDDIDVVSRATCTSNSIIEACKKVLENARIMEGNER